MKLHPFSPLLAICGLTLSTASIRAQENNETIKPAVPQDRPADGDRPQRGPRDGDGRRGNEHSNGPHDRRGPAPEMKPASYIGVLTSPLSPELSAMTNLPAGFGLRVEEVMPDSPAKSAGLQQHDVLVLMGDQKLVNQEQLSALVRAEKKDADVIFTVKRAGKDEKITIKIGERMMPVSEANGWRGGADGFRFMGGDDWRRLGEQLGDTFRDNGERIQEGMKQFREQMRDFGDKMRDWSRGPKDRPAPSAPRFNDDHRDGRKPEGPPSGKKPADKDNTASAESRSETQTSDGTSSSFHRAVTRRDDSGEYTLSDDNGAKVFTVKPREGEPQTFIVTTKQQRDALPEVFRDKLNELENANPPVQPAKPGLKPEADGAKEKSA